MNNTIAEQDKTNPKDEFIKAYKSTEEENHLIKLFNKKWTEILQTTDDDKWLYDLKLRINLFFQEILKLNNISFLFGTGSSVPLGAKPIFKIPDEIKDVIDKDDSIRDTHIQLYENYKYGTDLETYLGDLLKLKYIFCKFEQHLQPRRGCNPLCIASINALIKLLKTELIKLCEVPKSNDKIKDEFYKSEPLKVHKEFIKKILNRPINLKRINIFTLNYDLAFERAMEDLGVLYIDGFAGHIKRMFKPEVFNYDYYYPASTTEGTVHRCDKVLMLYKLHGSLNWYNCEPSAQNIYGIEQSYKPVKDKEVLIYPQPVKEEETLGFPYSELFRRFASAIQQPQNALIVYGYGFGDDHINRVIYNALSISTFQLIVVSYGWTDKLRDFYEKVEGDSRISFLIGDYLGDWNRFVHELLPDIKSLEIEKKIVETMKQLKGETDEKSSDKIADVNSKENAEPQVKGDSENG